MFSREERVEIFRSLFKGREDVFARRWEKWNGGVSGYSPVYANQDKESYVPLTTDWMEKHLVGTTTLGVYPLQKDNTSHFIVADFDGANWQNAVQKFLDVCEKHELLVATERSRSGNGAHVWCFFDAPYPASKSRCAFLSLLREAGCVDPLEKNEGFDRLFPNQDYLSGKGLGNLIALPLQGESRRNGNTVFVDPKNDFETISDQWQYLHGLPRVSEKLLDSLCDHESQDEDKVVQKSKGRTLFDKTLVLTLGNTIAIPKTNLPPNLASYLREELNILNIGYVVKERAGLPTYGAYLGEVIHTVDKTEMQTRSQIPESAPDGDAVIVRATNLATPFGATSRDFQLISKVLSSDANRNTLIAADIAREAREGRKCLVLTERKEHAEMLRAYLRKDFETIMFSGDLSFRQRSFALQKIKSGRFRVLIATGQILGEGADIADLEVLFLTFPVSFHGKLAQYIGRIRRKGGAKKVYDYRDANIPILEKLWKKRATYYRKSGFTIEEPDTIRPELLTM